MSAPPYEFFGKRGLRSNFFLYGPRGTGWESVWSAYMCFFRSYKIKVGNQKRLWQNISIKRWGVHMTYTYILECKDGSLYTGWTNNLQKRIKDHNDGKGAKYTKSRRPVVLAYYETFETKEEAMRREYAIKHMRRSEKEKLMKRKKL